MYYRHLDGSITKRVSQGFRPDTLFIQDLLMSIKQPRQKTKLIQVRCTEDEYERIHESARAGGLTVAEYIRRISLHRRITPVKTDYALVSEIITLGKQQNILAFQDGGIHSSQYADILEAIKNAINKAASTFG